VVTNEKGEKLSKQNLAPPINTNAAPFLLSRALHFLGHSVPPNAGRLDLTALWELAMANLEV